MKSLIQSMKRLIGLRNPLRVRYHLLKWMVSFAVSGNPAKGMYIIGVTGTKGKTTTSTLIARALEESGKKIALISTAQIWIAGHRTENQSKMTMDSPRMLWKMLKKAKHEWVTHVVLETSSHGIFYARNFGIHYDAVLLTNISQDHLDLHGTMEHYAETKARIFWSEPGKIIVLPQDCEYGEIFRKKAWNCITYSMKSPATFQAQATKVTPEGIEILIKWNLKNIEEDLITSKLTGDFNAENMLGAFALLRSIGMEVSSIQKAWNNFTGVPGRLEPVPNNQGIHIFVDYAHTEESLKRVLQTLSQGKKWRLILVFGATWDRDTTKRPKMGKVAHELADIIVLTDDDTYTESSKRILDMVQAGIPREIGEIFQVIPDRKLAIHWALKKAQSDDIVLIAGKWCETVQVTNAWPIPWSDRKVVEDWLQ